MKKIYKAPNTLCVKIRTTNMIAVSEFNSQEINGLGTNGDVIETKSFSDKNVWDDEW